MDNFTMRKKKKLDFKKNYYENTAWAGQLNSMQRQCAVQGGARLSQPRSMRPPVVGWRRDRAA